MMHDRNILFQGRSGPRKSRARGAALALMAAALLVGAACDDEESTRTFRDAAATNLQAGVNSILDGIVDGIFAIVVQGTDQTTDTSTTTTPSDGNGG